MDPSMKTAGVPNVCRGSVTLDFVKKIIQELNNLNVLARLVYRV